MLLYPNVFKKILTNFIQLLSHREIRYLDRILHQSILDRGDNYTEHLQYFYWENQIDIWDTVSSPIRPNAEEIKIYKKLLIEVPEKDRILVLGSTPEIRDLLTFFPGIKVHIADFSYRMPIAMLKLTKSVDPTNEIWIKANWLNLPFPENFFDIIIGDLVLQQFPPSMEELFLKKISSILKPTGHFISRFNFLSHELQADSLESIIKKTLLKPYGFWTKAVLVKLHVLWLYATPNERLLNRQISAAAFEKFVKDNNIKNEVAQQALRWIIADKNFDRTWSPPTKEELMRKISSTFSVSEILTAGNYEESIYYPMLNLKNNKKMKNFSRREFLKFGGGALAAAFLKELAMPKRALAKLEELLDKREFIKESFDEGVERLRKEVFESETERYFVFVKKGETAGWLNIEDKMSIDMGFSINLLPMLEDGKMEEMHFVHTHPLAIAEADKLLPPDILKEIRIEQKSNFPLLPSSSDIAALAKQKRFLLDKKLPAKITHSVLDPAGRWTYDVDLNHPEIQKISESKEPLKEGETKSEDELLVMSPEESTLFRMGTELLSRQELFYKDGKGVNSQNLEELADWYETKYGAILGFKRYGD